MTPQPHETVRVELGSRSYDVVVGSGLLDACERWLKPLLRRPFVAIVTDTNVAKLHLGRVETGLGEAGIASTVIEVPPGEASKSFANLERLTERLLAVGVERGDVILALGGGVIGDLAGFAAAILRRGVDFVQIPTTLLAQVDSSVGGKTGINTASGKNLVGAFHQPRLVLADVSTLDTLPQRELMAGYAEVLKYALIRDPAFFDWLESNGKAVAAKNAAALSHAVTQSCRAKAAVVAADEREAGERALLNLGHTFGHALEAATGYADTLIHGEAVSIGMAWAFALSRELGLCPDGDAERVARHMAAMGLPLAPPLVDGQPPAADTLFAHMQQDKKVVEGQIVLILARGIGQAFVARDIDVETLKSFLQRTVQSSC